MKISMFFLLILLNLVFAQDQVAIVAVGDAEEEKDLIAFYDANINFDKDYPKLKDEAGQITKIIKNDLNFYKHKLTIKNINEIYSKSEPDFDLWKSSGFRYVIISEFKNDQNELNTLFKVYDTSKKSQILNIFEKKSGDIRVFSHGRADLIFQSILAKASIFKSKIFFVSDKLSAGKKVIKELYQMDFDGMNIEKLTNHQSIVISPGVSPDNSKIIYSVIKMRNGKQNVDLYMYDLKTKNSKMISDRSGINSGGIFSGDSKFIYLTLSFNGNADIYEQNLETNAIRRITSHFADDVDPTITGDGKKMSFLSGRPGAAMIYTLDPSGLESNVKRISFVGQFNATPRFSPDGKEIVFSSWVDNRFDIYRIDSDGSNLVRLSKNFGSNEEPSYSNDGEFIAFSSQRVLSRRQAIQNLYIMTREGEVLGNITDNFGHVNSPRWSN